MPTLKYTAPHSLPNTQQLTTTDDLAARMVDGIHAYLNHQLATARKARCAVWQSENPSYSAFTKGLITRRDDLRRILGVIDDRLESSINIDVPSPRSATEIGRGPSYAIYVVRWAVLDGLDSEGLLLYPDRQSHSHVVAIPDADTSPEQLAGISAGLPSELQTARRLVESGCEVLVPDLIDRSDSWSQTAGIARTYQSRREFIYRMAYQIGRHISGYEIQKILAAVDWFTRTRTRESAGIGLAGHGEGGLLALYTAAIDERISSTLVSGYFQAREHISREPLYRNVWNLLTQFGDAELAAMVAPRHLTIVSNSGPEIAGSLPAKHDKADKHLGNITHPFEHPVNDEVTRALAYLHQIGMAGCLKFVKGGSSKLSHEEALRSFLAGLQVGAHLEHEREAPVVTRAFPERSIRVKRQFEAMVGVIQTQIQQANNHRQAFYWKSRSRETIDTWTDSAEYFREQLWVDVIGKLPRPTLPPNPKSRLAYERKHWNGYEVTLDLWPDVFAYGILLLPKDLRPGEQRPVVVCQHGLEGRPQNVVDKSIESSLHGFGEQLVERGFVVFAPQQPHIFDDHFRMINRKANPLGLTMFSFIVRQHERILEWLGELPYVDQNRIGFYGLSYGGFTGMRIPAILDGYCLSICSANFNDWLWKTTSIDNTYSYLVTGEFEIPEFNQGNTFDYAEMAGLIAPRPFMVERGHDDGVAPDERVAYEYAKVRHLYTKLGIPQRTAIEYFNGGHEVHGQRTFAFLHEHLAWPTQGT